MTKKEPKLKRIEEIINSAVDEFLKKGYENTSMESIAKNAGISKGGLYHHFKSKDEILIYTNQKLSEPVYKMMEEAINNISPKHGLKNYIRNYLDYWPAHQRELVFFFLSMTKALDKHELHHFYEEYLENYIAFFETLFKKGIELNEFKNHDARANSIILISAMDGVIGYLILNKNLKAQEIIKSFIEKFIDSISYEVEDERK